MIRSFDVPVAPDGTLRLPEDIMTALEVDKRASVTFLLADSIAHILPAPLSIEDIRGALPALDRDTDKSDDETLLEAFELAVHEKYG